MGTSKKDREKIKKLMQENEAFRKKLEALGLTIENVDKKLDSLPVDEYAKVNENYAKISEGGIIGYTIPESPPSPPPVEPPIDCGPDAHWDEAQGKCIPNVVTPPSPPPPPPTTGDAGKDRFGIPYLHKSKAGGFNYEMSDDPKSDEPMDELDDHYTVSGGVGAEGVTITMKPDGPTSLGIGKNVRTYQSDIGPADMKFTDMEQRGYMYKPTDVRDIEYKCIMKLQGLGDSGFSMSTTTGRHSEDPDCRGFAYMFNVEDPTASPPTFRFRKEMFHVSYHNSPEGVWSHPAIKEKLDGADWFGFGFCRYNSPDNKKVNLEAWMCPPGADFTKRENWVLLKKITDFTGNKWGNDGGTCGGAADQAGTWSGPQNRLKTNATGGSVQFKAITFREIDPSLD